MPVALSLSISSRPLNTPLPEAVVCPVLRRSGSSSKISSNGIFFSKQVRKAV
jgi:hypothetical protein